MINLLVATLLAAGARAAVVPPDARCIKAGDHTEAIPAYDPMGRTCPSAGLGDAASFAAAWDKLVAKMRTGKVMPVADGEVQQAVARGNPRAETLDMEGHWGDISYVQMRPHGARLIPVAAFIVTYRSQQVRDMLSATRMDFQTDGRGRLHAVHVWHGIRLPGAPAMAWSQGPVSTINQESMLEGLWSLRFRQLVESWAAD